MKINVFIYVEKRRISRKQNQMNSTINFNEINNDFHQSFFANFNDEECFNDDNQVYIRYNSGNMVCSVANDEIPLELYSGHTDYRSPHNENSEYLLEQNEINSVLGESEFKDKTVQIKGVSYTSSTDEADCSSINSARKSYDKLFTMCDDKNMYLIGQENDTLSTENNEQLVELDRIMKDSNTNMNNFIEDMLKNCPCDNLVKKQRIYKAKNIKRKRKTKAQIKQLEKELKKTPSWDKDEIKMLAVSLDLSRDQVYKWYWDQKNKSDQ